MKTPAFRFIVCSNGFGHLKRVLKVVSALKKVSSDCRILIECKESNLAQISKEPAIAALINADNVTFSHEVLNQEPEYNGSSSFGEFEIWLNTLKPPNPDEMVILDNEGILLKIFPDAVLMGSFLWSDVIESKGWDSLAPYTEVERQLLKRAKPYMLGLSDMATDSVRNNTRFVPLPWFVKDHNTTENVEKSDILITMGGSGKEKEFMDLPLLSGLERFENRVYADGRLRESLNGRFKTFDFSAASFNKVKLVIGRPGIGILTECVQYNIPIACIYEKDNAEMVHNAACVEKLGIGIDLMNIPQADHEYHVSYITNLDKQAGKYNFNKIKYNGAELAANWLLTFWQNADGKTI